MSGISRRSLLKGMGTGLGALAASGPLFNANKAFAARE